MRASRMCAPAFFFVGLCLLRGDTLLQPFRVPPEAAPAAEEAPLSLEAPQGPESVALSFVGDIMLAAGVGTVAAKMGTEYLLAGVKPILTRDDLSVGNLECAAASSGSPASKRFTFRAAPESLAGLRRGGIEAVTVANNHTLDYGPVALLETLAHLRQSGLVAAGGGQDAASAGRPPLFHLGTHTVALLAASRVLPSFSWTAGVHRPGLASAYEPSRMLKGIKSVRSQAEIVAVYLHWGRESAVLPEEYQRALARRCIDAGADLVVGSHSHVLQGFEYYRGRLIAYGLGNFVFTNHGNATCILQTTFEGRMLTEARVIPCRILDYRPVVTGDAAARAAVFRSLEERSFGVSVTDNGVLVPVRAYPNQPRRAARTGA